MKNLIYLTTILIFCLFALTSCEKESINELNETEAVSAARIAKQIIKVNTPGIVIESYEPEFEFDCCLYARYTIGDASYQNHIVNTTDKYKVIFTNYDTGASNVIYTRNQSFKRSWVGSGGSHLVKVQLVDENYNYANIESITYHYFHDGHPVCTPC